MTTPTELAHRIRFELNELSAHDGHHEFEHLCRELARARIVSNILPATGPVAGGGDQGRDFETFRTYLAGSLRFATGFLALATSDTVVFACTLQRDDLTSKIKADVKSICTQGTPVHRIYSFCAEAVKIADRHKLQAWASEEYQVALEVIDGIGIATLLSEPDVFWIAQTYLHLSEEMRPAAPPSKQALPDWYATLKDDWALADRKIQNLGEMMQVVGGLRHATDVREARPKLPEWVRLLEIFLSTVTDVDTAQRGRYEISRATLRGTGNLRPAEHHVRAFFANVTSMTAPGDLQDAGILLQYVETAAQCGESSLGAAELRAWAAELRDHVASLLQATDSPGRRAGLLNVAAHLSLHIDYDALNRYPKLPNRERHQHAAPDDIAEIQEIPDWLPIVDIDHAMSSLVELVDLLPEAPLFPVDSLAQHFVMFTPQLIDHAHYARVRSGLDEATSRQAGDASTAENCRKRAMSLHRSGRRLAALRELHEAKVSWWHGDTVRGSILAMLLIAHIYSELKLPLAAKKYALSAAFAAFNVQDKRMRNLVPVGLYRAASYDHQSGSWMQALELTQVAMLLQSNLVADPWDLDRHKDVEVAILQAVVIKAAGRHRPELTESIDQLISSAGLSDYVDEILAQDRTYEAWDEASWHLHSEQQMTGPPFGDIAPVRVITFGALGQRWRVQCRNERAAILATEDFCAAVQIVLVELTAVDPVFINSAIEVEIEMFDPATEPADRVHPLPDNTCARWKVYLPAHDTEKADDYEADLFSIFVRILHGSSMLPWDRFTETLSKAFRSGLMHKLAMVANYQRTVSYFSERSHSPANHLPIEPLGGSAHFSFHEAAELAAPTTPGPGYDIDVARTAIKARYENSAAITRITLPRVLADVAIRERLISLIDEGRPEWIVLMTLANIVANHRITYLHGKLDGPPDEQRQREAFNEMRRPEQVEDPPTSLEEITQTFEMRLAITAATVAQSWGLVVNQDTPDFSAIEALLKARYRYWEDDIEHKSYFRA
ncbi:hypothetical protein AB0M95_35320 [Sphaerisporangium sp. NPDC051017]|uniref:hypothetical protein n=1 Tax=Sphaerisporangium sp. NPDC051017 TaxID=3154636 RepID=UPI00343CE25E